jgi:predicted Zn-dependent protease
MTEAAGTPVGSLDAALAQAAQHLAGGAPALAEAQARAILAAVPGQPLAELYLGAALRQQGRPAEALALLEPLARAQPQGSVAHYELGLARGLAGRGVEAVAALRRAVAIRPDFADAWRELADHLHALDDTAGADEAYARYLKSANKDPRLMQAAAALCGGRIARAERLLRQHLVAHNNDVAALRMLAEVAGRLGRNAEAELLLARCLDLAPGFLPARHNYALALHRQSKWVEARYQAERLVAAQPRNPAYHNLHATVLARIGEYQAALAAYRFVLEHYPGHPRVWLSYGHTLKTANQTEAGIAAYREALRLAPQLGEAWWSLANLKTFRFTPEDIEVMRAQLARPDLADPDRYHLEFALGKALEDAGEAERAFGHYAAGNRLRRASLHYDPGLMSEHVRRCKALFNAEFFAARAGVGAPEPDPIFIVGLPRAGSTLIEQILASHPAVEGTMELHDLLALVREIGGRRRRGEPSRYPDALAGLAAGDFTVLGQRYLAATRVQRKSSRAFFIDKMPNNFAHIGLIHLVLPNARIIDARRHPLACCFSNYKQHFASGQHFSYDLADLGRYYRDYVELLAHFDAVLPGRVHRVIYERMVADTETEVRRLLQYCNVPFDAACLRFHENARAVRTASSEQVRRPINTDGVDQWRAFLTWLVPLQEALGPVLDTYPDPPML